MANYSIRDSHYTTPSRSVPYVIRPGRSSVTTTYQLLATVRQPDVCDADQLFAKAATIALRWFEAKLPQSLPKDAWTLGSFELDHHGQQQLNGVAIPQDGLWSARLVQPDAPFRSRPAVAGRTWTTDIALHRNREKLRFGIRVLCASTQYATEPIALTRPRVVIDLARGLGLTELRPLDGRPWVLRDCDDLQTLKELIESDERSLPVVLLTEADPRGYQLQVMEFLLDHEKLAKLTQGFAHVVCMPAKLSFRWTQGVGKVWSAFNGAVRTYQPQLDFDNDSPFAHPRVLADRILFWRHGRHQGEDAFAAFLVDRLKWHAATKAISWGQCLFFADARSRRAALRRESIRAEIARDRHVDEAANLKVRVEELEKAHAEEVEALTARIAEATAEAEEYEILASQYKQEADRRANENRSLQAQNDGLRSAISIKTGASADDNIAFPDSYEDMADWVEEHLVGRLFLHPRAIQGIKKASYDNMKLVYEALLLLAGDYRAMRLGDPAAKQNWEKRLEELELQCRRAITQTRAGEQGDTYFVQYPWGANQRRLLKWHVRKGSTKDDRFCLRIYFFWDEDIQQVVIGWLPSHLDTRAT